MLYWFDIENLYDIYCQDCKEKEIEPEYKDAKTWWENLE